MSEVRQKIPARLESAVKGGYVTGAKDIVDDTLGKSQSVINEEVTEDVSDLKDAVGTGGSVDERINAEKTRASNAERGLDTRLNVVEQLAEISVEGGEIGIATAEDLKNRTTEGDAKIPTVAAVMDSADDEPTAGSDNLVRSRGVAIHGGAFDVSEYNKNGNTLATYATLANALVSIPSSVRRGGMSIKFIQSSDHKYVQYRLISNEFTTDTTQWAIADEGVYVENPEFIYVKTDKDGKILWAIKIDGSVYYGAGVPQQVKDYIEEKISSLSLDEYEDIVAFLSDYLGGDTTLKEMIDSINAQIGTKLDAEGLDADALGTVQAVENPEYIQVTTDNEDKILEGITSKGVKKINLPIDTPSAAIEYVENPEWASVTTDSEGKVLEGFKENGEKVVNVDTKYPNGIPSEIKKYVDDNKKISDNINGYYNLKSDSDFSKLNATIIREGNNPCFSFNRKNGDCLYIHLRVKFPIDVHDVNGDFNILDIVDTDGIGKHYNAFLRKSITSIRTENPKYPIPVYKAGIYTAYDGEPYIRRAWRTYLVPDNLDRCLLFGGDAMSIRFTGDCSVIANQDIMFESTDSMFRILHSTNDSTIISYDKSLYPTMRDFYNKISQDIEDNVLVDYEVEFFNLDDYTPYDVINCKVHLVAPYQAESGGAYNSFKSYPYYFTTKDTKKQIYDLEFVFEKNSVSGSNSNLQLIINGYGIHLSNEPQWSYSQYLFNNDVTITIGERNSDVGVEILSMEVSNMPNFKYTNLRMLYAESMGTDGIRNPQSGYYISPDHLANIANSLKEKGFGYTKFQNILEYLRGSKVFGKDNIWHFRQDDSSWSSIMVEKNLETCLSKNIVSSFGIMLHAGITEDRIAKAKTLIPLGFEWYPHTAPLPYDPTIGGGQIGLGLLDYDDFKAAIDASIAKFVELFGFRPIVWDFHTVNDGGYNTSAYLRNHGFELILRQTGKGLITSINRYGCKGCQVSDMVSVNGLTVIKDGNYINDPATTFVDDVPEELN